MTKLVGLKKVKVFIRYNANKALQNLGFDPLFPDTAEDVDPIVMNGFQLGQVTMISSRRSAMVTYSVVLKRWMMKTIQNG